MTKRRRRWKAYAKIALRGNFGIMILGMFLTKMATMLANSLTEYFFSGTGVFTLVLSEIFSFVVSLILSILTAGYCYMTLKIAREENTSIRDILYFFKTKSSDRVIIAGFVMTLLQFIASVPMLVFNFTSKIGETQAELLQWQTRFLMLMLLMLILQMILTVPFVLAYYLLADHEEMSGMQAIKESVRMMKHHIGEYFLMQFSFIPMILLSALAFYLPLVWIMPYMSVVEAEFYREQNGEFVVQSAYKENKEETIYTIEALGEDNNSEG